IAAGRAARLRVDGRSLWIPAERRSLAAIVWAAAHFEPDLVEPPPRRAPAWSHREGAGMEIIPPRPGLGGPANPAALAAPLGLSELEVDSALARIEGEGNVLRGRFTPGVAADLNEWCDRRLLARIHRRTLDRLRREIEPVSAADLMRFLFAWQHVVPNLRLHGREGLSRVIEQ